MKHRKHVVQNNKFSLKKNYEDFGFYLKSLHSFSAKVIIIL